MSDGVGTMTDKEHELFMKTLQKEFEDTQFMTGEELELPAGNSTGSLTLDINLHVPIYCGSIVEIYSNAGAGKTTLVLSILAEAAKCGKRILFLNQERRLQATLLESFSILREPGVLELITAPTGEDALRIAELFVLQYPGAVVGIDSVDSLLPEQTEKKALGATDVGTLPKLMSQGCRKIQAAVAKTSSTVIFINQLRSKIGVMFGNPDITSGGRALPYYASQRIELMDITKDTRIKDGEGNIIGHKVRFKIIKNSVAPPFVNGSFPLIYGKGIDKATELCDLAVDLGILVKDGKRILVTGNNGKNVKKHPKEVAAMLRADPIFYREVLGEIKDLYPETFGE